MNVTKPLKSILVNRNYNPIQTPLPIQNQYLPLIQNIDLQVDTVSRVFLKKRRIICDSDDEDFIDSNIIDLTRDSDLEYNLDDIVEIEKKLYLEAKDVKLKKFEQLVDYDDYKPKNELFSNLYIIK